MQQAEAMRVAGGVGLTWSSSSRRLYPPRPRPLSSRPSLISNLPDTPAHTTKRAHAALVGLFNTCVSIACPRRHCSNTCATASCVGRQDACADTEATDVYGWVPRSSRLGGCHRGYSAQPASSTMPCPRQPERRTMQSERLCTGVFAHCVCHGSNPPPLPRVPAGAQHSPGCCCCW